MNKKRNLDILIGLIFFSVLGMYIFNKYFRPKSSHITHTKVTKANEILRRKSKIPISLLNTTATSSACTLFLKNTAELSMNDFANEYIDHQLDDILKTCSGAFPGNLQNKFEQVVQKCKTSTREHIDKECFGALLTAKMGSVATVVRPDVDPVNLSASILLHLIADKFFTGELLEFPDKGLALIDTLLLKEPNYFGGYKVKLLLLSMSSLNNEEHFKDLFEETLNEAKQFKVNDPELIEIALAERGNIFKKPLEENLKAKKEFIDYLEQESSRHPKDWIYDYYMANALYEEGRGNYEQTVMLVENALKKSPHNARLLLTLDNLKSGDVTKRNHPFVMAIGFSLDDL